MRHRTKIGAGGSWLTGYILISVAALNRKIEVLEELDPADINAASPSDGRALKIYRVSMSLTYGCWNEGAYIVPGYCEGAPNNWGGICFVAHSRGSDNRLSYYVKTMFTADGLVFIMRQSPDGTVEQNWKQV